MDIRKVLDRIDNLTIKLGSGTEYNDDNFSFDDDLSDLIQWVRDQIGDSDTSPALRAALERLRANEAEPLKVGDRVAVGFDNGVVSAIRGDQVQVGSARFYGGGWFEASKVSKA